MGRRRVEIKRIENKSRMQTTFTKRRQGLFKKANDYVNISAAEVAIITFSHAGNCFAWAHPSFDTVAHRYLLANSPHPYVDTEIAETPTQTDDDDDESENEKVNPASEAMERSRFIALLESEIKDLDLAHLTELKSNFEDLKVTLEKLLGEELN